MRMSAFLAAIGLLLALFVMAPSALAMPVVPGAAIHHAGERDCPCCPDPSRQAMPGCATCCVASLEYRDFATRPMAAPQIQVIQHVEFSDEWRPRPDYPPPRRTHG